VPPVAVRELMQTYEMVFPSPVVKDAFELLYLARIGEAVQSEPNAFYTHVSVAHFPGTNNSPSELRAENWK
jgi:hypothetical protein